jgi:hypothetical protein
MDEWVGCDGPRCPARAYVVAHFTVAGHDAELAYCSHHYTRYASRLGESAEWIDDRREPAWTR